jgi:hypothetical protein
MDLYQYVRRHPRLSLYSDSRFICALLATETLDDLTATERAARTHSDAPPRLPLLPFTDHTEMSRARTHYATADRLVAK